ncbi:MAG TPA: TetR/AcrR family transcriptional regulator [Azospirillaceae bacterium]|nr:TetR/AcrR family transcriptional regulator [Azospirillaceae bacterium]HRQ80723.1 TetR/AcrR family transcriptional regulator [Azospirillaceae bacterium]
MDDGAFPVGSKPAQILEAASELFLRDGFGAVSMDAVAREAGVSKATLYAHFESKDRLFAALVKRECARLFGEGVDHGLDGLTPTEGLTLIGRRFVSLLMSPKAVAGHRIVVAEAARFPELARTFYEAGPGPTIAKVAGYLDKLNTAGLLRAPDPALAAEQFLGMLKSHLHLRLLLGMQAAPSPDDLERLIAAAVHLFVRGYAP